MKFKSHSVEFEINEWGSPLVSAPEQACASARYSPAGVDQARDQIVIEANRDGLRTLARWLIALADEDSHPDHQHFDNELDLGLYKSDTDCELILQRVGK